MIQPEKDSLDAIATLLRSSRSVRTWNKSSAPRRKGLRMSNQARKNAARRRQAERTPELFAGERLVGART